MLFGVLLAVFTQVVPARLARCRTIRCCCCSTSCCSASSRRRRATRSASIVGAGVDRAQDAVPAPGDPARGRAHGALQPRCSTSSSCSSSCSPSASTPMWTWLLFPLLLVGAVRPHDRGVDDRRRRCTRASATSGSSGRSRRPRCSTRRRCCTRSSSVSEHAARRDRAQPADADLRARARKWIIDPNAPARRSRSAGGSVRLLIAGRRSTSPSASLAVWVFNREAPRIAEEL